MIVDFKIKFHYSIQPQNDQAHIRLDLDIDYDLILLHPEISETWLVK